MKAALSNTFGLFNNRVHLNALMDYRGKFWNSYTIGSNRCVSAANCATINVAGSSLDDQAAAVAAATGALRNTRWGIFQPNDFIKLREISVAFDAPSSFVNRYLHGRSTQLVFSGRNLATLWTKYPGIDPEANRNGERQRRSRHAAGDSVLDRPPELRVLTISRTQTRHIMNTQTAYSWRLERSRSAGALALGACNVHDQLLDVQTPDIVDPGNVAERRPARSRSTRRPSATSRASSAATAAAARRSGSTSPAVCSPTRSSRRAPEPNRSITATSTSTTSRSTRGRRSATRTLASLRAIRLLAQFPPATGGPTQLAQLHANQGFILTLTAEHYCNGIPLWDGKSDVNITTTTFSTDGLYAARDRAVRLGAHAGRHDEPGDSQPRSRRQGAHADRSGDAGHARGELGGGRGARWRGADELHVDDARSRRSPPAS